jgi:hypothetical protein
MQLGGAPWVDSLNRLANIFPQGVDVQNIMPCNAMSHQATPLRVLGLFILYSNMGQKETFAKFPLYYCMYCRDIWYWHYCCNCIISTCRVSVLYIYILHNISYFPNNLQMVHADSLVNSLPVFSLYFRGFSRVTYDQDDSWSYSI